MTVKEESCYSCRFWKVFTAKTGFCRRYPPQFWSEGENSGSCHPHSNGDEWCGEYQESKEVVEFWTKKEIVCENKT